MRTARARSSSGYLLPKFFFSITQYPYFRVSGKQGAVQCALPQKSRVKGRVTLSNKNRAHSYEYLELLEAFKHTIVPRNFPASERSRGIENNHPIKVVQKGPTDSQQYHIKYTKPRKPQYVRLAISKNTQFIAIHSATGMPPAPLYLRP